MGRADFSFKLCLATPWLIYANEFADRPRPPTPNDERLNEEIMIHFMNFITRCFLLHLQKLPFNNINIYFI